MTETARERFVRVFGIESPVALVTGSGARRVGRELAIHFALRGYRVVVHANHSVNDGQQLVEWLESQGYESLLIAGAIDNEATVTQWFDKIHSHFGRLDLLVNSAAIWEPKSLELTTAQDVLRHFQVNSLGTFLCSQRAGLLMVDQESGGAIVNIGDWAVERPYLQFPSYFISKGSIPTMTRMLAVELASRNPRIRCNAVLPGPVLMAEGTPQSTHDAVAAQSILKRNGTPGDLFDAVTFLAEHTYITGVCLPMDGGRSLASEINSDSIAHPDFHN